MMFPFQKTNIFWKPEPIYIFKSFPAEIFDILDIVLTTILKTLAQCAMFLPLDHPKFFLKLTRPNISDCGRN